MPCADRSSPSTGWTATRRCSCALDGELRAGDIVHARVAAAVRRATVANHTGTHLLQRALRNHARRARQAGEARPCARTACASTSRTRRRSDADELRAVEDEVNRVVLEDRDVRIFETSQDEARDLGATMLFGEKYGDVVRVVDITGYSMELCGGTHVRSTAAVGPFTIVRESSVGQGVRRIEAITGAEALGALRRARPRRDRRRRPRCARRPSSCREAVATLQRARARAREGGPRRRWRAATAAGPICPR